MFLFKRKGQKITNLLCQKAGLNLSQLLAYLAKGQSNYTIHKIRKRHKYRLIFEPNDLLKRLQRVVLKSVISAYPVSSQATAYEKGCSPLVNAKRHKKARFLAHYDIANFFRSINYSHFQNLLAKKYDYEEIKLLWLVCSLNDTLPLGAPSSPSIANRIMNHFDENITKQFPKLIYTRYADDLVFSAKNPLPSNLESTLLTELHQIKMMLNHKKTYRFSSKSHKKITGIVINLDGHLSVGKRYKKKVKKLLYQFKKDDSLWHNVLGHLMYIKSIEPDYYRRLVRKYSIKVWN